MSTIRDVMSTNCETVTPDDVIYEIAVKMEQNNIGFIPVVENHKLVGVVTDRDLVVRGYAAKRPGSTSAREVMTKDIVTVSPDTTIEEAAQIMGKEMIHRLAVVENGDLAGVLAIGDLAMQHQYAHVTNEALHDISQHTDVTHH